MRQVVKPKVASFMETGLDYSNERSTDEEREHLLDRYRSAHGTVDLDLQLVKFAPFLIEFLPAAFKRMRADGTSRDAATGRGKMSRCLG